MPGSADDPSEQDPARTWDPNRSAIWPTFRPGTRLPTRHVRTWVDVLGLAMMLVMMAGAGFLVWWFIETVHRR